MKSFRVPLSLVVALLACLTLPAPGRADDVVLSGTTSFASLDGSADDHDGTVNGVFTVSDGNLTIEGTVTCNDDPPLGGNAGACPIEIVVSGDLVLEAGGGIFAENRRGGGNGGSITLTVGGKLALRGPAFALPGAVISSGRTTGTGNAGDITASAQGEVELEAGTTVSAATANGAAGAVRITGAGVRVGGLVASGPSRTVLGSRLTGTVLSGGSGGQAGGPITLRSTGAALRVGAGAVIVSQGENPGAGPVLLEGCGVEVRGLVASISKSDGLSAVTLRSGEEILVDGSDLGASGPAQGRLRADSTSGGAAGFGVDLFARGSIQVLGPPAAQTGLFAASSTPGDHPNRPAGGTITAISLDADLAATGNAFETGRDRPGNQGGTIDLQAKTEIDLDGAVLKALGGANGNPGRKGGTIRARAFQGGLSWTFGTGDVRPVGTGAPAASQGSIVLTACTGIDTTGTQFPTNGSPILPFPVEDAANCSAAAPVLPAGEPALPVCNQPPTANPQTVTTDEDTPVTITLTGSDPDGDPLTFSIVTPPTHGTLGALTSPTSTSVQVVYTPAADYSGPDSFEFQVSDGQGSDTATVDIEVGEANDPPAVNDATFSIPENSANGTAVGTVTFTDPDSGQTHTFAITAGNTGGAFAIDPATGAIMVASSVALDFETTPTFSLTVEVTDDGSPALSGTGTVTVNLTNVNEAPIVTGESYDTVGNTLLEVSAAESATVPHVFVSGSLLANDVDPDSLSDLDASLNTATAGAIVTIDNETGTFTYLPPAGATGTDTFTYNVTDGTLSSIGTVTIQLQHRVWYVKNDTEDGDGLGRSADPFDTLAEAEAASAPGDTLHVDEGDGETTGQDKGIALKADQRLIGEGVALEVPVSVNGGPNPTVLLPAGNRPQIDNTTAGGNGVSVTNVGGVEIRGLDIAGAANAIDVTTTGTSGGGATIRDNTIRAAGAEGIDVNAGGTGTLTVTAASNDLTATGNAFDARSTAGALQIDFSSNANILSNASGVVIDGSGGGVVTITGFANNSVHPNTVGTGIQVNTATFDANPTTAGFQLVSGGTTAVGASGNGVGGSGIDMTNVSGDLAFTDLDIFADGGGGLRIAGTGAVNPGAGTGTRVAVGVGVAIIEAVTNAAVDLNNLTADLQLSSLKSTNSTATGVSLTNVSDGNTSAIFTAGSGSSITTAAGATGPTFNVSGGNAAITYAGTIINNSTSARAVSITTWAGDDASDDLLLSGAIDENGAGILVNGNGGGHAITFSGGMDIDTTTGEGFAATSNTNTLGLHITGTNTIDSVSATALRVTNTAIGSSNLTFRSISSGNSTAAVDPANGIVLSNTGSSGGLVVTGNGGACTEGSSTCTGGWIQNMTGGDDSGATPVGTGIVLNNTANVSLTRMRINDTSNYGIRGTNVSDFTFANGIVDGANGTNESTPFNDGSLLFFGVTGTSSGMTGTSSIINSTIRGGRQRNIAIDNSVGTLNLMVSGNTIKRTSDAAGDDGFFLKADTTANVTLAITNNTFARHGGDHINVTMLNNAVVDLTITGNTLHGNYVGTPEGNHPIGLSQGIFILGATFNGICTYEISNNGTVGVPFRGNRQAGAIHVNKGSGTGTFSGSIENNVIGDPAVTGSGSSEAFGIIVGARGAGGSHTTLINNNLVRQYFDRGIVLEAGEGSAAFNATVTNNTVSDFADAANSLHGIHSDNGILATDNNAVCLQISGNFVATAGNEAAGGADIRLRRGASTTVRLPGVAGATNANAAALLQANNPTATTITVTGNGFSNGAACPLP